MKIDLTHNKIVADTMSERFRECFSEGLLPLIEDATDGMTSLVMYEDYIADGFSRDGRWYYPFVVTDRAGERIIWASWQYDKRRYASPSPYSYTGTAPLDFTLHTAPDEDIECVVYERSRTVSAGSAKLNITTTAPDTLMLVGKYSQSFVDEMARQLAKKIEAAAKVEGFADSPIELELVFGSGTYMEHTAGKVTYRRLLMVDGASRPRDFWVKWYSPTSDRAYSVSDHISRDELVFEIAEDVSQKIREKEYRFLCGTNPTKYQAAMGKRNVTEWRDIIKRAIRRGELVKSVSELEYIESEEERELMSVDDELDEALRRVAADNDTAVTEEVKLNEDYDDISALLSRMLATSEATVNEGTAEDNNGDTDETISFNLGEGLTLDSDEFFDTEPDVEPPFDTDEAETTPDDELADADVTPDIPDATADVEPVAEAYSDDEGEWEPVIAKEDADSAEEPSDEPLERDILDALGEIEIEPVDEIDDEEIVASEEVKIREHSEEYERRLREEARREFAEREARLREEYERREEELRLREARLREENERLGELARRHEERHEEISRRHLEYVESSRQTEEELRRELEAREALEARERDRIAEAARQSIEEERRARMAASAPEPEIAPEPAPVPVAEPSPEQRAPEYMSKRVKIIFRSSVDYSVFGRIKETIESTVISLDKADVTILMRASLEGDNIINLNITKMPKDEEPLLISIVKAIGNSRIGVTKIIIEDL